MINMVRKKYWFLFLLFICFFLYPDSALAAKKMAVCEYGNEGKSVVIRELDDGDGGLTVPITISIYDDGTVELSTHSNTSSGATGGTALDEAVSGISSGDQIGNALWHVEDDFEKDYYNAAYNQSNKTYNCPVIQVVYQTVLGYPRLDLYLGDNMVPPEGGVSYALTAELSLTEEAKKDGLTEQLEVELGERTQSIELDSGTKSITIIFKLVGDDKKFGIKYGTNPNDPIQYGHSYETVSIGTHTYQVNQDDVDYFWQKWKDKKVTTLYIKKESSAGSTNGQLMTIQRTKPKDEENGSYDLDQAKNDDGTEYGGKIDYMPHSSVDPNKSAALNRSTCELINVNTTLGKFLHKMINYIKIGTVFLVLVLGMVDLTGAVGSSEEGAFKKAGTKFGKRLIAAALVFLVPAIVNILISLVNDASCANDPNYDPTGGIFDTNV